MSRRSIAGKRPYRDHYNGIGHYNDDEAYEQDMDVWKGKRKAVNNFFKALRSPPTSSAPRSASTSSAPTSSAPTSSAPTSSAPRTAPDRALASTSSSPARPPTRHKKSEDIDIIKSSESQKTEKTLADLKERQIILQKRNDTIQQSMEKIGKKVILHRAEHITESDEDDSDSDVTFIENIAHQAEHTREDSDDVDSASWPPQIISDRDDQRNMDETSTEADGDDLDFSLEEEDNIPDFDETVKKVPQVAKKLNTNTLSDLEIMLNAERLKNKMLQTKIDQVHQDHLTKNLSQEKALADLKEKNSILQKKLDTQETFTLHLVLQLSSN